MAKHVEIQEVTRILWECDHCNATFDPGRKGPAKCGKCGKDLCKSCKRHIHLEVGGGNGRPVTYQCNETVTLCPECYVEPIRAILSALGLEINCDHG
jgi:hypothetical protein